MSFSFISELVLFGIIILFSIKPVENYDVWFHLKYGEYITATKNLPFTDIFSHTAYGLPAVPYEWLSQTILYLAHHALGAIGIQSLVVLLVLLYFFLFRQILVEIFHVSPLARLALLSSSFLVSFDFWVERPQLFGYVFFMAVLYLGLKRAFLGKNWLWLTPFIMFLWTNTHASMVLGLYILFALMAISYRLDKRAGKDFFLWGLLSTAVTLLPPLGTKVYELLWLFFKKREFIVQVIDEWVLLTNVPARLWVYAPILLAAAWLTIVNVHARRTSGRQHMLLLPLLPLSLFAFTGVRQTPFAAPATLLLFVPFLHGRATGRLATIAGATVVLSVTTALGLSYRIQSRPIYPSNESIAFVRSHIQGNMFNEYQIGGYLMYHLGPDKKTFIDGRTDMFLSKVLPEYVGLIRLLDDEDNIFLAYFNTLARKYDISWAFLTTESYTLSWKLGRLLRYDPAWQLVYFDDSAVIYVRTDGINAEAVSLYGLPAAAPLRRTIYKEGHRDRAKQDYEAMYRRKPSAIAANALGYFALEDEQFDAATEWFHKALAINPEAAAPKMNLAELARYQGNIQEAIALYRQAIKDDPGRGLGYLRLGQLIVESGGTREEAEKIWKEGLVKAEGSERAQELKNELNRL